MSKDYPTATNTAGIILCGGEGRRLGQPKSAVSFQGAPMLHQIAQRLKPQCRVLAASVGRDRDKAVAAGLPVILDDETDQTGPLVGVASALNWAAIQSGIRYVFTSPVDTPFVPRNVVARLAVGLVDGPTRAAVAMSNNRVHGLSALYDLSMADQVASLVYDHSVRKVQTFHKLLQSVEVEFQTSPIDPFFNVNTTTDLGEAEALANRFPDELT